MSETEKEMTPEERINYLRERGILVETPEDRRREQIKTIMNETDVDENGEEYDDLKFVHVPHNESLPIRELSMKVSKNRLSSKSGDLLLDELKPFFSALSKKADISLFKDSAAKHFGSADAPQVSVEALRQVTEQAQVETFALVRPTESNKYTSVNIYLDEVGMLKRLPLNKRAADLASKAGFNPAPSFYGDIFIGRIQYKPVLHNIDFKKEDTTVNSQWLQKATMENLEYQTEMNQITGTNEVQASADGANGVAKAEKGYSWTQTEDELEIVIELSSSSKDGDGDRPIMNAKDAKAAGLKVKYFPKKTTVQFQGKELLSLEYFASVDTDGCTWTLDSTSKGVSLVITCEKADGVTWPRITA